MGILSMAVCHLCLYVVPSMIYLTFHDRLTSGDSTSFLLTMQGISGYKKKIVIVCDQPCNSAELNHLITSLTHPISIYTLLSLPSGARSYVSPCWTKFPHCLSILNHCLSFLTCLICLKSPNKSIALPPPWMTQACLTINCQDPNSDLYIANLCNYPRPFYCIN